MDEWDWHCESFEARYFLCLAVRYRLETVGGLLWTVLEGGGVVGMRKVVWCEDAEDGWVGVLDCVFEVERRSEELEVAEIVGVSGLVGESLR